MPRTLSAAKFRPVTPPRRRSKGRDKAPLTTYNYSESAWLMQRDHVEVTDRLTTRAPTANHHSTIFTRNENGSAFYQNTGMILLVSL